MSPNLFDVTNKVVIVTGAAGGIGRAMTTGFATAGAVVIAADLAQVAASDVAQELRSQGCNVTGVGLDVSDDTQIGQVLDFVIASNGGIDVLVNNAGVKSEETILTGRRDAWERTLDINARSVITMSRMTIDKSMRDRGGSFVNTGSSASSRASILNYQAGGADYCFSKAMVHSITQLLAYEAAPFGITVNAIAPGIVDTPMHGRPLETTEAKHAGKIPLNRIGRPEDFVGPALFLCSAGSRYITGQILHVNGGMVMEP